MLLAIVVGEGTRTMGGLTGDPDFAGDGAMVEPEGATPVDDGDGAVVVGEGTGVDDFGGGEEAFRGGGAGVAFGGGEAAAAAVTVIPNAMMGQCPGTPQINQKLPAVGSGTTSLPVI